MAQNKTTAVVGEALNSTEKKPGLSADERRRRKMLRTVKALGGAIDPMGTDNEETLTAIKALVGKLLTPVSKP